MLKKRLLVLGMAVMMLMTACSSKITNEPVTTAVETTVAEAAETERAEGAQTRIFADSSGREVEISSKISKVAVSGPLAQIVMYSFAPEMMVGFAKKWTDKEAEFIPEEYLKLPVLGQLYGGKGELNLEELVSAAPDLVVDIGESKKTIKEDMDSLQEQTGVPFVHIEADLQNMADAYKLLGDLLGLEERANEFAVYCEQKYKEASDIAEQNKDGKKKLLYVVGEEGLNVIAKGSFHAQVIDMLADNVAVVDEPSPKGSGNEVDMEKILGWNPEMIVFAPESIYDTVSEKEEWLKLDAIKEGNYYKTPYGPYNWMGFPPSVQRYLGMIWLNKLLYPEQAKYDLKAEVVKYYNMFYHVELTDEQYEELMKGAIK